MQLQVDLLWNVARQYLTILQKRKMVNNMLKIRKELWIMIIQFIVFLGAQIISRLSGDMYGSLFVVVIIYPISVLILSIAISWTESKFKYLYPIYVAIIFLLMPYIFLNGSSYSYSLIFTGISAVGMVIGLISNYISEFFTKDKEKNKN